MNRLYVLLTLLIMVSCSGKQDTKKPISPRFNHVMLYVSDLERTITFYTSAFDLEVTNRLDNLTITQSDGSVNNAKVNMAFLKFPNQNFVYEISERPVENDSIPPPFYQHVGIDVEDVELALERALNSGGILISPIRLVEGNGVKAKIAFLEGPDGETVELMQLVSGEF